MAERINIASSASPVEVRLVAASSIIAAKATVPRASTISSIRHTWVIEPPFFFRSHLNAKLRLESGSRMANNGAPVALARRTRARSVALVRFIGAGH
jgi:hypothetical protein